MRDGKAVAVRDAAGKWGRGSGVAVLLGVAALMGGALASALGACSDTQVGTCRPTNECPSPVEANGECFCSGDGGTLFEDGGGEDATSEGAASQGDAASGPDGFVAVDSGAPADASAIGDSGASGAAD